MVMGKHQLQEMMEEVGVEVAVVEDLEHLEGLVIDLVIKDNGKSRQK